MAGAPHRAVSPVVGTLLLIAITVALGTAIAFGFLSFSDVDSNANAAVSIDRENTGCPAIHISVIDMSRADNIYYKYDGEAVRIGTPNNTTVGAREIVRPLNASEQLRVVASYNGENTTIQTRSVTRFTNDKDCIIYTSSGGSTHQIRYPIEASSPAAGDSLNNVSTNYPTGFNISETASTQSQIAKAGFDTDGDGTIDTDVLGDIDSVTALQDNTTIAIEFTGNYNINSGTTLLVAYEEVQNPSPGTYEANVTINDGAESTTSPLGVE